MFLSATAMKYNKILEELYLGDNDLSSSDGSPIGAMLTYNTSLQLLDLRNNQIKVSLPKCCEIFQFIRDFWTFQFAKFYICTTFYNQYS